MKYHDVTGFTLCICGHMKPDFPNILYLRTKINIKMTECIFGVLFYPN